MNGTKTSGISRLLILWCFLFAGCASQRYVVTLPVCPAKPSLPIVMEVELQGLSNEVYRRLVDRELLLLDYVGELKSLCQE